MSNRCKHCQIMVDYILDSSEDKSKPDCKHLTKDGFVNIQDDNDICEKFKEYFPIDNLEKYRIYNKYAYYSKVHR